MSAGSSIGSITDIVSPANIVQWYDAQDLSVGVGNPIPTWNDRSSSADHLTQVTPGFRPTLQIDSGGFQKALFDYNLGSQGMTTTLSTMNTDETVIIVFNRTAQSNNIRGSTLNILRTLAGTSISQITTVNTEGVGRLTQNTTLLGKQVITFSRRASSNPILRNSIGFSLSTGTFTNTTYPAASQQTIAFAIQTAGLSLELYSMITINQYVDDNTLKSLIRTVGFQKNCLPF